MPFAVEDLPRTHPAERLQHAAAKAAECYAWVVHKPPLAKRELAGALDETRWFLREVCEAVRELDESLTSAFGLATDSDRCLGCRACKTANGKSKANVYSRT